MISMVRAAAVSAVSAVLAIGLATGMPVYAAAEPDVPSLVLPGSAIPGNWELVDQQSGRSGQQELDLYHELQTDAPGRIVGLAVTRYDDVDAAAASMDSTISQARNAGQPGATLDDFGDGPAVAFVYRVADTQVREHFGFDPDALGETVMVRVDRYVMTIQVGGPASELVDVDALAAQLSELQVARVRDALAAPTSP